MELKEKLTYLKASIRFVDTSLICYLQETPSVELNTSDLVEPEESTATSEIPAVGAMEEELNAIGATETSTNDDINAPASLDKPEVSRYELGRPSH